MKIGEILSMSGTRPLAEGIVIRPFQEKDLASLVCVYQSAFAEPPWDEYKKCSSCQRGYGLDALEMSSCVACGSRLVDFWSASQVEGDLRDAQQQPNSFVLVAESGEKLVGFTWGYALPVVKFPFLAGRVNDSIYMDEIAVSGTTRLGGIGTALGDVFLREVGRQGKDSAVLRTDERNTASMALFKRLGFRSILDGAGRVVYDPEFASRIYLSTDRRYAP